MRRFRVLTTMALGCSRTSDTATTKELGSLLETYVASHFSEAFHRVRRGLKNSSESSSSSSRIQQDSQSAHLHYYTRKVTQTSKTNHVVQVLLQASTNMSSSHTNPNHNHNHHIHIDDYRLSTNHPPPKCQKGHVRPSTTSARTKSTTSASPADATGGLVLHSAGL